MKYAELYEEGPDLTPILTAYNTALDSLEDPDPFITQQRYLLLVSVLVQAVIPTLEVCHEYSEMFDAAWNVFSTLTEFTITRERLLDIIEDCFEGYAIFPGSEGMSERFDWFLREVIPSVKNLRAPKYLYTVRGLNVY